MSAKIRFLIALENSIRTGAIKRFKQALDFARREFGEIDDNFFYKILDVFKKQGKTKKGGIVDIKTRKEYKKELDETLGPADDVFGSPIKDQKMKEFDKAAAKDVTPKTDKAKKLNLTELEAKLDEIDKERAIRIRKQSEEVERRTGKPFKEGPYLEETAEQTLKKRTDDIASGDPTGEITEGVESLGTNMKKLKELVEELKKTSQDTTPGGIMKEILKESVSFNFNLPAFSSDRINCLTAVLILPSA